MQNNKKVWPILWGEKSQWKLSLSGPDVGFNRQILQRYFKYLKKLQETIFKEFQENIIKMTQQVGTSIKKINFLKRPNGNSRVEK